MGAAVGAIGGAGTIFSLVFAPIGAGVGSIVGLIRYTPEEQAARIGTLVVGVDPPQLFVEVLQKLSSETKYATREGPRIVGISRAGEKPGPVRDSPTDGNSKSPVLSVRLDRVRLDGYSGRDPVMRLDIAVQVEVAVPGPRGTIYSEQYAWIGPPHALSEWQAGNQALLVSQLQGAATEILGEAMENIFALEVFPVGPNYLGTVPGLNSLVCGLPNHSNWPASQTYYPDEGWAFAINSIIPTFNWDQFPREQDKISSEAALLHRITNVTYELSVWSLANPDEIRLVYHREKLTAPFHTVDAGVLEYESIYAWSVRANFEVDGEHRSIYWSRSEPQHPYTGKDPETRGTPNIMRPFLTRPCAAPAQATRDLLFRFRTPCRVDPTTGQSACTKNRASPLPTTGALASMKTDG